MTLGELAERLGRWAGDSEVRGALALFVIIASLPIYAVSGALGDD